MKELLTELTIGQRVRLCVLQDMLDHTADTKLAVELAREAALWILQGETVIFSTAWVDPASMEVLRRDEPVQEAGSSGCGGVERPGKNHSTDDALAPIAEAVKRIGEQPEAAHGDGCPIGEHAPQPTHEEPAGTRPVPSVSLTSASDNRSADAGQGTAQHLGRDQAGREAATDDNPGAGFGPADSEVAPSDDAAGGMEEGRSPVAEMGEVVRRDDEAGSSLPRQDENASALDSGNGARPGVPEASRGGLQEPQPVEGRQPVEPTERADDARIRRLAGQGWTYEAIAAQIGKTSGYVRSRAKELGIAPRQPGPISETPRQPSPKEQLRQQQAQERRAELKRMWEEGVPAGEIAKKLGYASAHSVTVTAGKHMGLAPRKPEKFAQGAVAEPVAAEAAPAPASEADLPTQPATPKADDPLRDVIAWLAGRGIKVKTSGDRYLMNGRVSVTAEGLVEAANRHRKAAHLPPFSLEAAE